MTSKKEVLKKLKKKLVEVIKIDIKESIVTELMKKYDEEIIPLEDPDEPELVSPSFCREEFKEFLEKSIEESIRIEGDSIKFGVGEEEKLGIGKELDEETTNCLKIIGTILNGISGEFVLVTSGMTGKPEGRTGEAELWTREGYDKVAIMRGWDPNKKTWQFSNFPGVSNFWDVELDMNKYIEKAIKGLE
jgi:hypothetical protein